MDKRSTVSKKIGIRIAELRKDKGLTQEKLAEITHLNRTFVGYIEKGDRNPTNETLNKIAKALDVSLSELFKFD